MMTTADALTLLFLLVLWLFVRKAERATERAKQAYRDQHLQPADLAILRGEFGQAAGRNVRVRTDPDRKARTIENARTN